MTTGVIESDPVHNDNDVHREIGRLEARLNAMENWADSLKENLSDIAKSMKSIEIEMASAKASGKAYLGVATVMGGIVVFVVEHIILKRWF